MHTSELEALRAFRHQVYRMFGCRRDALFDLIDAVLTTPGGGAPPHPHESPSAAVALVVGTESTGPGGDLARVRRPVLDRTPCRFFKQVLPVDDSQAPVTGGSRSLDLGGDPRVGPTPPGTTPRR
jgi:hypothetical protein